VLNQEYITLANYRLKTACETLDTAKILFEVKKYRDCNNRCYYCIFHALRAVLALEGKDFSKHSGVIQHFQRYYIKTGALPKEVSKAITEASIIRNQSDYSDFFIASRENTKEQIVHAEYVYTVIEEYIQDMLNENI